MSIQQCHIHNENLDLTIKQIQKSRAHVQKIVQSARKMIKTDTISTQDKQKLQIKISIENDHLKNSFYRIHCPYNTVEVKIIQEQYTNEEKQKSFSEKKSMVQSHLYLDQRGKSKQQKPVHQVHSEKIHLTNANYSEKLDNIKKSKFQQQKAFEIPSKFTVASEMVQTPKISKIEDLQKTDYKTIIDQNKQKLFSHETKKYKIHYDRLEKKSQVKKSRLYSKSPQTRLTASRQRLHSAKIKNTGPCQKCVKHQYKHTSTQEAKQKIQGFHLVKKYLTYEGEQECYNFLRGQGIPESDWPIYITQYVYKQLSKLYNSELRTSRVSKQ